METFIRLTGATLPKLNTIFWAKYPEGVVELLMVQKEKEIIFITKHGTEMNSPKFWKKKD